MSFVDEVAAADEKRTYRRAQALRNAELDRIGLAGQIRDGNAGGLGRVEYPCAVYVHRHAGRTGTVADIGTMNGAHHAAAAEIVRILKAYQARFCRMVRTFWPECFAYLIPRRMSAAAAAADGAEAYAGQHRSHSQLVIVDVRSLLDHHFLARPGVHLDRDLIAHRTAGDE